MTNETFYNKCAELLGANHEYVPFPWAKRTRWNNRSPGSGRFEGFGIIRVFGDKVHVSLRYPVSVNKVFNSKEEVLVALSSNGSDTWL